MRVFWGPVAIATLAIAITVDMPFQANSNRVRAEEFEALRQLQDSGVCTTCELPAANLRGADLSYVQLSEADLEGVKLYSGNPVPASLEGSNLASANLRQADLRRVILRGALLYEANLAGANLFGADLRGANLMEADLRGANLEDTIGLAGVREAAQSNTDRYETSTLARPQRVIVASADEGTVLRLQTSSDWIDTTALLQGAIYDEMTHFPADFDPVAAGMQFQSHRSLLQRDRE